MFRTVLIFCSIVMASLCFAVNVLAQGNGVNHVTFDGLTRTDLSEVSHVIDPMTVQLHDGRLVRLSGVDIPDFHHDRPGPYALLAMDILNDMLVGQTVQLYQSKAEAGKVNRMGMQVAHIQRQSDGLWVQGALLSLGLARVRTSVLNAEMSAAMYEIEGAARAEETGLWKDHPILSPDDVGEFDKSVQIVEGRVVSTALVKNRLYINFGTDWKTDFTVSILPENKRIFSKSGIDPLQWNGKMLRVRGWIGFYNGPYIEVDHPQAIEVLGEPENGKVIDNTEKSSR